MAATPIEVEDLISAKKVQVNGSFAATAAQLLLLEPDPSGRAEFGGEERELQQIHNYQKALKSLMSPMKKMKI